VTRVRPTAERFYEKVEKTETCWLFRGAIDPAGYGRFNDGGKSRLAHRIGYEFDRGPIPIGLVLDHLCRVRACVRPDHLEAVTVWENGHRSAPYSANGGRTACPNGHAYDLVERTTGRRRCRRCTRDYIRMWMRINRLGWTTEAASTTPRISGRPKRVPEIDQHRHRTEGEPRLRTK